MSEYRAHIDTHPIDRATLAHRHHREHTAIDRRLAQLAIEQGDQIPATTRRHYATPAGDERKLRGIPAIARGVSGHIPGTRP